MAFEVLRQTLGQEVLARKQFERNLPIIRQQLEAGNLQIEQLKNQLTEAKTFEETLNELAPIVSDVQLPGSEFAKKYKNVPESVAKKIIQLEQEGDDQTAGVLKLKYALSSKPELVKKLAKYQQTRDVVVNAFPGVFGKQNKADEQSLNLLPNRLKEIQAQLNASLTEMRERYRLNKKLDADKIKNRMMRDLNRYKSQTLKLLTEGKIDLAKQLYTTQLQIYKDMIDEENLSPLEKQQLLYNMKDVMENVNKLYQQKKLLFFNVDSEAWKRWEERLKAAQDSGDAGEVIDVYIEMLNSVVPAKTGQSQQQKEQIQPPDFSQLNEQVFNELEKTYNFLSTQKKEKTKTVEERVKEVKNNNKNKRLKAKAVVKNGFIYAVLEDGTEINTGLKLEDAKKMNKNDLAEFIKNKVAAWQKSNK